MSNEFYCKFCDITCTGKAPYEQHIQSAKHLKKALPSSPLSAAQSNLPSSPKLSTRFSQSPITTLDTSDDYSISSPSFSISSETMKILLEWNHPNNYKPYCDICQLPLHGKNNADLHFDKNNNLHSQKLLAWKQIQENDAPYSCKVCSEIFLNEDLMRNHFTSDIHANMVQQKNNLKKFIQIYETYNKLKQIRIESKDQETNLVNQFQDLKVIDGTEEKTKPIKLGIFDTAKLSAAMKNAVNNDDD